MQFLITIIKIFYNIKKITIKISHTSIFLFVQSQESTLHI